MTYPGPEAIAMLSQTAAEDSHGASAYWRKEQARFRFTGQGFAGVGPLGGATQRRPLSRLAHAVFQRPSRRLGAHLPAFPAMDALANQICVAQGRNYDLAVLRHTLTMAFVQNQVPERVAGAGTACVIGDGFGTMTALLAGSRSVRHVILVNLTRSLLVDLWYLRLWLGDTLFARTVLLVTDAASLRDAVARRAEGDPVVIAVQAQHHELLRDCSIDIAFNMVSMGEMDPPVVAAYFSDLRAAAMSMSGGLAFYCCNREEKILPDGTVTRFADYPWQASDRVLADGPCPWHQRYYSRRPPFYHPYDGPVRHRLALLVPERGVV